MESKKLTRFLQFLRQELSLPEADLRLALRHSEPVPNLLPMILWQYGLVTLNQLNQIFEWLEQNFVNEV